MIAGIEKAIDPRGYSDAIAAYRIIPDSFTNIISFFLPYIEIITALFLILGIMPKVSSAILIGLIIIYLIALFSVLIRGIDIDCGCIKLFSNAVKHNNRIWIAIGRNVALLSLGIVILIKGRFGDS